MFEFKANYVVKIQNGITMLYKPCGHSKVIIIRTQTRSPIPGSNFTSPDRPGTVQGQEDSIV